MLSILIEALLNLKTKYLSYNTHIYLPFTTFRNLNHGSSSCRKLNFKTLLIKNAMKCVIHKVGFVKKKAQSPQDNLTLFYLNIC